MCLLTYLDDLPTSIQIANAPEDDEELTL